ncbi:hypothetical protein PQ462_00915 [Flavobacterium sp. KACC 22758]|jgi:hypothetical protein|uniref:hypothetical protein n=1 Tax=Flavobacterium sp. KACC 22758 TaxID=3025667 RepID=UPI002366DA1B|nr:hypothetical protein [Flavobacterium sp. KACC 22758]WDF59941.1 hypothetical protein PQ462_00915 [Flavobacterium sp. KACC 22758]
MNINKFLSIIFSVLIISCKGQDKEKNKETVNLNNLTLLGVTKKNSLYTVINRCDGGYPVLRFYKNRFYFYIPQEGAYYLTESIKEIENQNYQITTKGYYFLSNEKPIPSKKIWYLRKIDQLLWDFGDEKSQYQFADSISLIKRKIKFYNQPCRECWDDEECNKLEPQKKIVGTIKLDDSSFNKSIELVKQEFINIELPKLKKTNKLIGGIDVLETYLGDVTNDNINDIVLFYSLTAKDGNANISSGLNIYKNTGKEMKLIQSIIPDFMFYVKKISNDSIYVEKIEYRDSDSRCCPSLKSEVVLKVNKSD